MSNATTLQLIKDIIDATDDKQVRGSFNCRDHETVGYGETGWFRNVSGVLFFFPDSVEDDENKLITDRVNGFVVHESVWVHAPEARMLSGEFN